MSEKKMAEMVKELRELKRMSEELAAEIESIQDSIKEQMTADGVDTISGVDWKITWKSISTTRLDTAALKKEMPDLASRYTKVTTSRRFTVA